MAKYLSIIVIGTQNELSPEDPGSGRSIKGFELGVVLIVFSILRMISGT